MQNFSIKLSKCGRVLIDVSVADGNDNILVASQVGLGMNSGCQYFDFLMILA